MPALSVRFSRHAAHRAAARTLMRAAIVLLATALPAAAHAQETRFGRWQLKSDAPPPASNIMTYEAWGTGGMKITVESVNGRGEKNSWWYTTMFDGADMPVSGTTSTTHASVRPLDDWTNEIINKRDGRVTTVLTNVLSRDGSTLGVIYMRDDGSGNTTGVSFATYERITP